jgi:hypothetical protein
MQHAYGNYYSTGKGSARIGHSSSFFSCAMQSFCRWCLRCAYGIARRQVVCAMPGRRGGETVARSGVLATAGAFSESVHL